jgi:hypothetical protein
MYHRAFSLEFTDVSEVRTASISREIIAIIHRPGDAVYTSETSVHSNVTLGPYIPKDSKLHTRRYVNLKYHKSYEVKKYLQDLLFSAAKSMPPGLHIRIIWGSTIGSLVAAGNKHSLALSICSKKKTGTSSLTGKTDLGVEIVFTTLRLLKCIPSGLFCLLFNIFFINVSHSYVSHPCHTYLLVKAKFCWRT